MNMLHGLWIDIFPYGKVSNNKIKCRIDYLMFLVRKDMYIVNLFLSRRFLINRVETSMIKYKNKNTDYVFSCTDNNTE